MPDDAAWVCPECGYPLAGLKAASCPECGRVTSEAEQREMVRRREMPRTLETISQVGIVLNILVWVWSVGGILITLEKGGVGKGVGRPGAGLGTFALAFVVSTLSIPVAWWVHRRLREIHRRNEVWSWAAAHGTWLGPLAAIAIMRPG